MHQASEAKPAKTVVLVSPALQDANNGNWHTARRWAQCLSGHARTTLLLLWPPQASAGLPGRWPQQAQLLTVPAREVGVAAIPISAFYEGGFEQGFARLCFAKKDESLNAALERLARRRSDGRLHHRDCPAAGDRRTDRRHRAAADVCR